MQKRTVIAISTAALGVVILAVAVVVAVFLGLIGPAASRTTVTMDPQGLLREVKQLSELVSVKYSIQKVVGLKEEKVPFGSESLLLVIQGTVLAGVDLKEMEERDIRIERKDNAVFVRIPQARILHVYLDDKQTKVWDRRVTWWTPWVPYNPDLERKARVAAIDSMRAQAEEMGILKEARRNAEQTLQTVLQMLGRAKVTFIPT
jgi:hypothetical protein